MDMEPGARERVWKPESLANPKMTVSTVSVVELGMGNWKAEGKGGREVNG